jgi:hypothetical protein
MFDISPPDMPPPKGGKEGDVKEGAKGALLRPYALEVGVEATIESCWRASTGLISMRAKSRKGVR